MRQRPSRKRWEWPREDPRSGSRIWDGGLTPVREAVLEGRREDRSLSSPLHTNPQVLFSPPNHRWGN